MMTAITTTVVLLLSLAPRFPSPPIISLEFHAALADGLRIPRADAQTIYNGYSELRSRILTIHETRSHIRALLPNNFEAEIPKVDSELSDFLTADQRRTTELLLRADRDYFELMTTFGSDRSGERQSEITDCMDTWRMQWLFDSPDLPIDRLPGFVNIARLAGCGLFPSMNSQAAQYRRSVGPKLAELEQAILIDPAESHELLRKLSELAAAGDPNLSDRLNEFVAHEFRANDIIARVRQMNLASWSAFENSLEDMQRLRFAEKLTQQLFPYIPALSQCYHEAAIAFDRARTEAQRQQIMQIVMNMEGTLRPLVIEVDAQFVSAHKSSKRRLEYNNRLRRSYP